MTDWVWSGLACLQGFTKRILPPFLVKFNPFPLHSLPCSPPPPAPLKHPVGISPPPAPSHHLFIFINTDSLLWSKPIPSELPFKLSMALHLIWIFFCLSCRLLSLQHCRQDVTEKPLNWRKSTILPGHAKPRRRSISFPPLTWSSWHTDAPLFIPQWGICSANSAENGLGQSQKAKKKRIHRLKVSEQSLPWTLPQ